MNTQTGSYAHEYGHMLGYWYEDYTSDPKPQPKFEFMRGGIMYSPYGVPYRHHFQRIFGVNIPKN